MKKKILGIAFGLLLASSAWAATYNMGNRRVVNVGAPTGGTDATTKTYVDVGTGDVSIAAAATVDLATASRQKCSATITGSGGPITAFGTVPQGVLCKLTFTGLPQITYNSTSLKLPWQFSITMSPGATLSCQSLGSGNWSCTDYVAGIDWKNRPLPSLPGGRQYFTGDASNCCANNYIVGSGFHEYGNGQTDGATTNNGTFAMPMMSDIRTGTAGGYTVPAQGAIIGGKAFMGGSGGVGTNGAFQYEFGAEVFENRASTVADQHVNCIGYIPSQVSTRCDTNGDTAIFFEDETQFANWQCRTTRASSPGTTVDTGVPAVATLTGIHHFEIVIPPSGTPLTFWIDNLQVCSISTNLPNTITNQPSGINPFVELFKVVGTATQDRLTYVRGVFDWRLAP
jgi:hypothetical protein